MAASPPVLRTGDQQSNRYQCTVDIRALVEAGKNELVLHVPVTVYTRMCKPGEEGERVHLYMGRKRTRSDPLTTVEVVPSVTSGLGIVQSRSEGLRRALLWTMDPSA